MVFPSPFAHQRAETIAANTKTPTTAEILLFTVESFETAGIGSAERY
jgi:hypothetical protein